MSEGIPVLLFLVPSDFVDSFVLVFFLQSQHLNVCFSSLPPLPLFKLVVALANPSEDMTQIQDLLLPTSALSYKQALLSRQTSSYYLTGQKGNRERVNGF